MKWIAFLSLLVIACSPPEAKKEYETWRPHYHFTPERNWTNDPNGLLYANGEYHLFYQHNPFGNRWGHMSWGHAVSKDLYNWEHLPVAINEYKEQGGDSVMIFSGSAVNEGNNIVAVFTGHVHRNGQEVKQYQCLAYSNDHGRTFAVYPNNPVLDIQRHSFRDPKVFWHAPTNTWIMAAVLADKHKVLLYGSTDLKEWSPRGEFGPLGDTTKVWECPDLFPVPLESDPSKVKWVMIVSNSHPQGGPYVGMQYFVGEFDGKTFTADNPGQYPLYVDYGKDLYAGVTFNNAPGSKPILLGWVNNWAYANDLPTTPWKGAMSLPRELSLFEGGEGLRLRQRPVDGLKKEESKEISHSYYIEVELEPIDSTGRFGFKLFDDVLIGFDGSTNKVFLDRLASKNGGFHKAFPSIEEASARRINGKIRLSIYVDQSIIEVFINDGEAVITDQFFPGESNMVEPFGVEAGKVDWHSWAINKPY